MADNIKEVNNQINAKLGISSDCQTTYEAVRAQVKKLGGDLSKVHDIYTGELEVLEYISGEPNLQDKSVSITENGELDVKPDEGFDGLSNVTIETNVQPSLQDKSVSITENNSTTAVNADDDYYGLKSVNVSVNIPITDAMDVSYTENGIYEITPDPGDEGIKKINVSVEVESSCPLSFADINYYNSDDVQTDLTYSKTKLEAWDPTRTSAYQLYYNDKTLKYAPKIDTSNVTNMYGMFGYCSNLTTVPLFDTSNVTNM